MKLEAKARLQAAVDFKSVAAKDLKKMSKKEFEKGYDVELDGKGGIYDKGLNKHFSNFNAWAKAVEESDDDS